MADLDFARGILRIRFGFADFLPGQAEPVAAALDGEDVFVLWPTGARKIPRLSIAGARAAGPHSGGFAARRPDPRPGPEAERLGLPAAALHADLAPDAWRKVRDGLESGRLRLLYVSPGTSGGPGGAGEFSRGGRARAGDRRGSLRFAMGLISGRITGGSPPPPPSANPRSSRRPPRLRRRRART